MMPSGLLMIALRLRELSFWTVGETLKFLEFISFYRIYNIFVQSVGLGRHSKSVRNYRSFKNEKCFYRNEFNGEVLRLLWQDIWTTLYNSDHRLQTSISTRCELVTYWEVVKSSSRVIEQFETKKLTENVDCNNLSIHVWQIQMSECLRVSIDGFFVFYRVHLLMSYLTRLSPRRAVRTARKRSPNRNCQGFPF